jgi:hypothetical protein
MININKWTINKVIIENRVFFAGGYPKYLIIPRFIRWGKYISVFWLGTELCISFK